MPSGTIFSDEKREIGRLLHEIVSTVERTAVEQGHIHSRAFAGGSCKTIFCHDKANCNTLNRNGECRHRLHARPSMSGFGINVSAMMKSCGWPAIMNTKEADSDHDSMTW